MSLTGHTGGFQLIPKIMIIENPGPTIGTHDIALIEMQFDVELPDSYRKFLLDYNGGTPNPDTVDVPGAPDSPTDVQVFFGIGREVESSDLAWNVALVRERCPQLRAFPVACDSGGNLFCISGKGGDLRNIIYVDLGSAECCTYEIAACFDDFIAEIRPYDE